MYRIILPVVAFCMFLMAGCSENNQVVNEPQPSGTDSVMSIENSVVEKNKFAIAESIKQIGKDSFTSFLKIDSIIHVGQENGIVYILYQIYPPTDVDPDKKNAGFYFSVLKENMWVHKDVKLPEDLVIEKAAGIGSNLFTVDSPIRTNEESVIKKLSLKDNGTYIIEPLEDTRAKDPIEYTPETLVETKQGPGVIIRKTYNIPYEDEYYIEFLGGDHETIHSNYRKYYGLDLSYYDLDNDLLYAITLEDGVGIFDNKAGEPVYDSVTGAEIATGNKGESKLVYGDEFVYILQQDGSQQTLTVYDHNLNLVSTAPLLFEVEKELMNEPYHDPFVSLSEGFIDVWDVWEFAGKPALNLTRIRTLD